MTEANICSGANLDSLTQRHYTLD